MEVLDATSLAERLKWEAKEYWLHLEADTPLEKYPAKQHARRVQEQLGVRHGLIYLPGQPAKNNEDSDMPAPFRQRRYFYYLSGCDESDCHLTYDIQHDTLSLFIPRIDENRVIWNGRGSTLAEAVVKYDIDEVYYADELSGFIDDWYNHTGYLGSLYVLHDSQMPKLPVRILEPFSTIDATSLQPAMDLSRMIKDDHEIKLIRKANDISSYAHREVLAHVLDFNNEAQIEGLFLNVCVSKQAKKQAYNPIVASGPNAGTLHYDANNEDFEDRQLLCLDAGCEFELYASDITRTFPLSSSWPSDEAESIYKLVERMQESCIKRLAPGVRYLDLHILAHQIAIDGLLALGILHNGTKEEIYKAGTSRAFFPHGLGHHVGLEVHDVGQVNLMSVRRGKAVLEQTPSLYPSEFHHSVYDPKTCHAPTDPQSSHLEEGMVVTVEPGIYFSLYALQHFYLPSPIHSKYINTEVVQRYLPVGGVRIEDDILITSNGYENLTTAPKGDQMMATIRKGKSSDMSLDMSFDYRLRSQHRKASEKQPQLLRAPGILTEAPEQIMKPIARAATMPVEFKQRRSVDFELFNGPSLFSNFKRAMTTDERIQHWQQNRERSTRSENQPNIRPQLGPLCGDFTDDVKHVHMSFAGRGPAKSNEWPAVNDQPICSKCNILCETLSRLRKKLMSSELGSPKPLGEPTFTTVIKREGVLNHRNEGALANQPRRVSQKRGPLPARHEWTEKREFPHHTKQSSMQVLSDQTQGQSFKTIKTIQNDAQRPVESRKYRKVQSDEQARAKQPLRDLRAEREDLNQPSYRYHTPSTEHIRDTEIRELPHPSNFCMRDNRARAKEQNKSTYERLSELQERIAQLKLQLKSYPDDLGTPQSSQPEGQGKAKAPYFWERMRIEDELKQLTATRATVVSMLNKQKSRPLNDLSE